MTALLFLPGDLPSKDVAVDVRVDSREDQALEFDRRRSLHLPLHRAAGIEAVPVGEGRPPRVTLLALGRRQLIGADAAVGQQDMFRPAPFS